MLLRTLFILMLLAVLGETLLHAAHALAQASLRRQAALAARHELDAAMLAARTAAADAIVAGGDPRALTVTPPPSQSVCRLAGAGGSCALFGSSTIAFDPAPASTPSPCASGACTIYEQENDAVAEGRIGAMVTSQATAATGEVLATRTARVTFRTIAVAPYATIAGYDDADNEGAAPNGAAPGTLLDVLYENRLTGATLPGNVWRPQIERSGPLPPAWSP